MDLLLGGDVDRRRGVVEQQDPGVGEQRPGQGDLLALAAGQGQPPLADHGVVALGQGLDEVAARAQRAARSISWSEASGRP